MAVTRPSAQSTPATSLTVAIEYLNTPNSDPDDVFRLEFGAWQLDVLEDSDVDALIDLLADRAAAVMPTATIRHRKRWGFTTPEESEPPVVHHEPQGE